ncbi:hypothetical protein EXU48_03455 [Occultella glacieicola]|uniref:Uncharacterized protein n=1 Tax=Occultella glacieicola TaxID=2518684 RepID=A0ABY2EAM6_9MICO|nr:Vms1/Ankzf1 family peptidyl-tRNA hydrolase [Occultella glacieicola]TDE97274.1 hypothetical protein EXU48_03455 [Occultella glacieicola]
MRLNVPELPAGEPVVTVILDATRASESGDQTVLGRWADLRRQLHKQGADGALLEAIEDCVSRPTWLSGPHGRVVVAAGDRVYLDRSLASPPGVDRAVVGDAPHVFALARVADCGVRYLLVTVDRAGADLSLHDTTDLQATREQHSVEGDHDELAKPQLGPLAHKRIENRAEDSWERNAEVVAAELDRVVAARRPELVLLTGDLRAVSLVRAEVGQQVAEILMEIEGGARTEGVNTRAFDTAITNALEAFRLRRREVALDLLRQEQGRDGAAVSGVEDVVDVLRKGQVAELVVTEEVAGPPSAIAERLLWVGPGALELALTRSDLTDLGVSEPRELRADLAIGRAALEQGAGITVADAASVTLIDGVGAVLRWNDAATPGETAYTRSTDRGRV